MKAERIRAVLDRLNRKPVVDEANLRAFRGSRAVQNHYGKAFTTKDGKSYIVVKGQIRRLD